MPTTALDHCPYKSSECGRASHHRGSLVHHCHSHWTGECQCSLCPLKYSNLMALHNNVWVHCKDTCHSAESGCEGILFTLRWSCHMTQWEQRHHNQQMWRSGANMEASALPTANRTAPQIYSACDMCFDTPKSLESHRLSHSLGERENSRTESRESRRCAFAN